MNVSKGIKQSPGQQVHKWIVKGLNEYVSSSILNTRTVGTEELERKVEFKR